VKSTIHWVSAAHALDAEVRLYDKLFTKEDPNQVDEGQEFTANLNPNSLEVIARAKWSHRSRMPRSAAAISSSGLGIFRWIRIPAQDISYSIVRSPSRMHGRRSRRSRNCSITACGQKLLLARSSNVDGYSAWESVYQPLCFRSLFSKWRYIQSRNSVT